jgi:hypothetical protein
LTEHLKIQQAINQIRGTRLGGSVIERLTSEGWTLKYAWVPPRCAAFTFPLKRIHVKPGLNKDRTLGVLTHEIFHAVLYGEALSASIEQEYYVESYALLLRHQLASSPEEKARAKAELRSWFGRPVREIYEALRHTSAWHYSRLPLKQPTGLRAAWVGLVQAITFYQLARAAPPRSRDTN